MVKMLKPKNLLETYEMAIIQEQQVVEMNQNTYSSWETSSNNYYSTGQKWVQASQTFRVKNRNDSHKNDKTLSKTRKIFVQEINIEEIMGCASNVDKSMVLAIFVN